MEFSLHVISCFFLKMLNLRPSMPSVGRSGMPTLWAKHFFIPKQILPVGGIDLEHKAALLGRTFSVDKTVFVC
jgi:hypothetical protein